MRPGESQSPKKVYFSMVDELIPIYGKDEASQLVKLLLTDILEIPFEKILVDEQIIISAVRNEELTEKMSSLKSYIPIQYVMEKAHFFGRDFYVDSSVLIPRQETEELVNEIMIDNKGEGLNVLDIGSGSGCIGISLGLELKNATISALDIDGKALDVTLKNARKYGLPIHCLFEDILTLEELPGMYDIIVSNPPYVTESEKKDILNNVLEHEPHLALFVPDKDPLIFYKKIIRLAKNHLRSKGKLYFEINEHFGRKMIELCEQAQCSCLRLIQDLNGKDRFIKIMFD